METDNKIENEQRNNILEHDKIAGKIRIISDPQNKYSFDVIQKIWKYFRLYDPVAAHFPKPTFDTPEYTDQEILGWKKEYDGLFLPLFKEFIQFEDIVLIFTLSV